MSKFVRTLAIVWFVAGCSAFASQIDFTTHTLATDQTDANLVNPWGIVAGPTTPLWISANGSGTALVYTGAGVKNALTVTIPGDGTPTGAAFNGSSGAFNGDLFLFDSEDGTVSGWRNALGSAAETLVVGSTANVYKGITNGTTGGFDYAYLANFRTGNVDVLKGETAAPDLTGKFTDPNLPAGFAPFDIQNLGGVIYVTYAKQDATKHDDVAGTGNGVVDKYDLNGNFLGRLVSDGALDSPWGLAIAPAGFADLAGDLLVGNFGDGTIHAYNPTTGALIETLDGASGNPLTIDGLWGLRFGNGAAAGGSTTTLFFTAGPNDESGGLFGTIAATPEPGTFAILAGALLCLWYGTIRSDDRFHQSSKRRDAANL